MDLNTILAKEWNAKQRGQVWTCILIIFLFIETAPESPALMGGSLLRIFKKLERRTVCTNNFYLY